jgi:hypothetical protein
MLQPSLDGIVNLIHFSDVHLYRQNLPAHFLDLSDKCLPSGLVFKTENDIGASLGQGQSTGFAYALGRSCNKRYLTGQCER